MLTLGGREGGQRIIALIAQWISDSFCFVFVVGNQKETEACLEDSVRIQFGESQDQNLVQTLSETRVFFKETMVSPK